jgi:hypothetical protein
MQDCSQEAQQSLQSALQFVQRIDQVVPRLDSKWFVAPVIAMALQHMSPDLSRKVLQPLMAEGTDVPEHRDRAPAKQPLKRALFPELQPNGDCEEDSYAPAFGAVWHRKAFSQVSAHISAGNATQLAALIRSLPIQQALAQLQGSAVRFAAHTSLQLTYSSVLLLHLVQALPGQQGMPEAHQPSNAPGRTDPSASAAEHSSLPLSGGLEPVVAQLALHHQAQEASLAAQGGAGASRAGTFVMAASVKNAAIGEAATEEAYRRCRKHLRQLEAHHLAALLRFWLLHGPAPLPGVPGSRPELHGALRLRVLQDGVAALERCVDKPHGAGVALTRTEQHPKVGYAQFDKTPDKAGCRPEGHRHNLRQPDVYSGSC